MKDILELQTFRSLSIVYLILTKIGTLIIFYPYLQIQIQFIYDGLQYQQNDQFWLQLLYIIFYVIERTLSIRRLINAYSISKAELIRVSIVCPLYLSEIYLIMRTQIFPKYKDYQLFKDCFDESILLFPVQLISFVRLTQDLNLINILLIGYIQFCFSLNHFVLWYLILFGDDKVKEKNKLTYIKSLVKETFFSIICNYAYINLIIICSQLPQFLQIFLTIQFIISVRLVITIQKQNKQCENPSLNLSDFLIKQYFHINLDQRYILTQQNFISLRHYGNNIFNRMIETSFIQIAFLLIYYLINMNQLNQKIIYYEYYTLIASIISISFLGQRLYNSIIIPYFYGQEIMDIYNNTQIQKYIQNEQKWQQMNLTNEQRRYQNLKIVNFHINIDQQYADIIFTLLFCFGKSEVHINYFYSRTSTEGCKYDQKVKILASVDLQIIINQLNQGKLLPQITLLTVGTRQDENMYNLFKILFERLILLKIVSDQGFNFAELNLQFINGVKSVISTNFIYNKLISQYMHCNPISVFFDLYDN